MGLLAAASSILPYEGHSTAQIVHENRAISMLTLEEEGRITCLQDGLEVDQTPPIIDFIIGGWRVIAPFIAFCSILQLLRLGPSPSRAGRLLPQCGCCQQRAYNP